MSASVPGRVTAPWWADLRKLPAFARRDLLTLLSYRYALVGDWVNLVVQLVIFGYVSRLVPADQLPRVGDTRVSYIAFASVGIAISSFLQIGLGRATSAMRMEQLWGTLESLFATPTSPLIIQFGAVVYDSVYIPLRTTAFLVLAALLFDVPLHWSGVVPTMLVVLAFVPFVWGLGAIGAAALMTFRRGDGVVAIGASLLGVGSGAYFPTTLFPHWAQVLVTFNPVSVALTAVRDLLLDGADARLTIVTVAQLFPAAGLSLIVGSVCLRLSVRRERRLGTLGNY